MKIGYARVSTDTQKTDMQMDALRAAGCEVIFQDVGESGRKGSRPELDRMLASLKEGDIVIVWHLDRMGRDVKNLIDLVNGFNRRKIGFKTLTGVEIDTSTSQGEFVFHLFAALAQLESRRIGERTKTGIKASVDRGTKWNSWKIKAGEVSRATLYRRAKAQRTL